MKYKIGDIIEIKQKCGFNHEKAYWDREYKHSHTYQEVIIAIDYQQYITNGTIESILFEQDKNDNEYCLVKKIGSVKSTTLFKNKEEELGDVESYDAY